VSTPPSAEAIQRSVVVVESSADIARSPEDVFDYCSDHTREGEWNVKMKHVRKLTDGPRGLGTRYEMEFVPGRPMVVDCVRFERPTEWQMSGQTMGMRVGWGGQVVATKTGSRLILRMQLQPRHAADRPAASTPNAAGCRT
jgi:hypothetical protein